MEKIVNEIVDYIDQHDLTIDEVIHEIEIFSDIKIDWNEIPPKFTQQEIYEQLFDLYYLQECKLIKDANIYASKNTVRIWREQYVD